MTSRFIPPRRRFLAGIGVASMAGLARSATGPEKINVEQARQSDYLLAPGMTYLNTASLGATPRSVMDRTVQAWHELESNPVLMAYSDGAVAMAADKVRDRRRPFWAAPLTRY
jgi:hypothetical protein